jgi:HD-like signal output (HDOD) protein
MAFRGNISTFNPPDLLMFLSQMDKEGMLSVTQGQDTVDIQIKSGMILDARSDQGDRKLLTILFRSGRITKNQLIQLRSIQKETGIPVRQIFEKLNATLVSKLEKEFNSCIMDVLLQFCLLKKGEFQFIDVAVEAPPGGQALSCQSIILELARQTDDWLETAADIGSLDQRTVPGKKIPPPEKLTGIEILMMNAVSGGRTVSQLVELLPKPRLQALKLIHDRANRGWLHFTSPDRPSRETRDAITEENHLLLSFKQAYRQLLMKENTPSKIERILVYCGEFFEQTVLLSAENGILNHCRILSHDSTSRKHTKKEYALRVPLESESVFEGVLRSGRAFFGELFASKLLGRLLPGTLTGSCALMLLEKKPNRTTFLFVFSKKKIEDVTSFHYLELLSWLIAPPKAETEQAGVIAPMAFRTKKKGIDEIISSMNDLPPMPQNVTRTLRILADPDKSMPDVADVLGEDQAMMARLLKVSNSVLYRTGEEIRTLKHALTRLGSKTIRNIVLSSSTQAMFSLKRSGAGVWSQALWQHAKECALSARCVARILKYPDPEEAFAGGMLHDVGKLVILLKYTDEFRLIRKKQISENISSIRAERSFLEFDHSQAGKILMEKWRMPRILGACVRHHHSPEKAGEFSQIAHIIGYGNYLANQYGTNENKVPDTDTEGLKAIQKFLKVDNETIQRIETAALSDLKQTDIFD